MQELSTDSFDPPRVSVLIPLFNCEKHMCKAVESVLNQTYHDFELIVVNDGSTDSSEAILKSYKDERIRIVKNKKNRGLVFSLNSGLFQAKGEYLARMDCDDMCLRNRIERQVQFLDDNPEIGICGTWYESISELDKSIRIVKNAIDPATIKAQLLFFTPLAHPTVMMRLSVLRQHNLIYNPEAVHVEDFDLWRRCSYKFPLANVPEVLFRYRVHEDSISSQARINYKDRARIHQKLHREYLDALGIQYSEDELRVHYMISDTYTASKLFRITLVDAKKSEKWLKKLKAFNEEAENYDKKVLDQVIADQWLNFCSTCSDLGISIFNLYMESSLTEGIKWKPGRIFKLFIKCFLKWNRKAIV